MSAFVMGWTKHWKESPHVEEMLFQCSERSSDLFNVMVMSVTEGKRAEQYNKSIAELFGAVVTKVKACPTSDGSWIILDKHTKFLLHKNIKNENEVDLLCKKNNYIR